MKDIAKKTGLGLATVSKYFNGGTLREANRVAIEKVLEQNDYTINQLARSLKTKRTRTIGIVIPKFSCIFTVAVITAIQEYLRSKSYGVIVSESGDSAKQEKETVDFMINKMVDGIICMSIDASGKSLATAIEKGVPVVLFDRYIKSLKKKADMVVIDNKAAAEEAISFLIENGHSKIGVITGPRNVNTASEREQACVETLEKNGIKHNSDFFINGKFDITEGYKATKKLLSSFPEITAIFATNYDMTLGMFMALNELDVSIPTDLSVIGFDNFQFSDVLKPRLTVVHQPSEIIGKKAAELLLERLETPDKKDAPTSITTLYATIKHGKTVSNTNLSLKD